MSQKIFTKINEDISEIESNSGTFFASNVCIIYLSSLVMKPISKDVAQGHLYLNNKYTKSFFTPVNIFRQILGIIFFYNNFNLVKLHF